MVDRNLAPTLNRLAEWYPVVSLTGPRQSGKTTLCRAVFGHLPYASLEPLDERESARRDPRSFLARFPDGAVLDEIQHVPELLSYLQVRVDADPTPGRWIVTGSQNLALSQAVSQSLAGRTGVLHLLPLSFDEVLRFGRPPESVWSAVWQGGFPRPWDREIPTERWLSDYVATYVERDVRQIVAVGELSTFTSFLRLCAARTATELNLAELGRDAGVTHNTVRSWLSVLEAGFVVFRLPSWHRNVSKQQIKAHKLHFIDSGLACYLLGIRSVEQLSLHPLRGALFQTWVAGEIQKWRLHRGLAASLFHYRETRGVALDLLVDGGARLAVEIKSGATIARDWFDHLLKWDDGRRVLVHGGATAGEERGVTIVPWNAVPDARWD